MDTIKPEVAQQLLADIPPGVLRSIIMTFEADVGRLARELLEAGSAGDAAGCHRAAHGIAGAAAALGAARLEREARFAMNPAHEEPLHVVMPRLMVEAQAAIEALRLLKP